MEKTLAEVIEEAMGKLGVEDEDGDVQLWNAIENDTFKIMIVHKGVMRAAGFTDSSPNFHQDDKNKEAPDVNS